MALFISSIVWMTFFAYSSSLELKLSQIIYRHGQRSPSEFYPKDKHKGDWPEGLGEMTNAGKMGEYLLGKFLRAHYNEAFLNKAFNHSEVYVRSTDIDRTLESAQLVMAGMYPPVEDQKWNKDLLWQPIPVHTISKRDDHLLLLSSHCPRYDMEFDKAMKKDPLKSFIKKYQSLYDYLSSKSGMKVSIRNAWVIFDDTFNEQLQNLTVPDWVKSKMEDLTEESNRDFGLFVPNDQLKRLKGGPLVKQIIANFDKSVNNKSPMKMYQFSAHDTTISILMCALKIYNKLQPPYSSAILFELFENKTGDFSNPDDAFTVKISYRNDSKANPHVLRIPSCAEQCPLASFKSLTKSVIPEDVKKECMVKGDGSKFKAVPAALFIVLVRMMAF